MVKNKRLEIQIALERINRLLRLASDMLIKNEAGEDSARLSKRYVGMARKIGSHYKVGIPSSLKRVFCRKCNTVLVPGLNCRVRISSTGYAVYKCGCGADTHIRL